MQIVAMKKDICYWSTEEKGKEIQDNESPRIFFALRELKKTY